MRLTVCLPAQPGEAYPNGGGEGFWMGKIADRLERLLSETGTELARVFSGNAEPAVFPCGSELYLTLCSRAAPPELAGQQKGLDVCYAEQSALSKQAAEVFAARLKEVYPQPELAGTRPVAEAETVPVDQAPVLTVKLAYHDNPQDEAWLVNSTDEIAEKLAEAAKEVLGLPEVPELSQILDIPEIGLHSEALFPEKRNA